MEDIPFLHEGCILELHLTLWHMKKAMDVPSNMICVWIAAILVVIPFAVASTAVLMSEQRMSPTQRRRWRSLGGIMLLLVGVAAGLSIIHSGTKPRECMGDS